jgi:hypothetical protein
MFGKKNSDSAHTSNHKYSVYIKLQIAGNCIEKYCGERVSPDDIKQIKGAARLNTYDNVIQKAEASLISTSPELWFHHGPSTFTTTPKMIIDIGHGIDQLSFKIVDDWFSVETTYSEICIFCAPVRALYELIDNGHLGHVGIEGVQKEISAPLGLHWIDPINERIDGGMTNTDGNGITATYTNELIQLSINKVFELAEHPQIYDR